MKTPEILIRDACEGDFEWVANLMHRSLEPYYGGDHHAHAKRIFDAHIAGGHDRVGFFSFEQHMSILEVDGARAGLIHVVGKRQSTYKISPLIVAPEAQGKLGLGRAGSSTMRKPTRAAIRLAKSTARWPRQTSPRCSSFSERVSFAREVPTVTTKAV